MSRPKMAQDLGRRLAAVYRGAKVRRNVARAVSNRDRKSSAVSLAVVSAVAPVPASVALLPTASSSSRRRSLS